MYKKGFACGFPLGRFYKDMDNYLLMSVTEKRTKNEIEHLVKSLEEVLCS
jgi:glycine cleavage system pyridoxal-binding protein P